MNVVWSELAIERAYDEARYIAEDKPEAALAWLEGLFASTDRLERFPKSGKAVPEIGRADYRQLVYRSHRIVYRIEAKQVSILTVRRFKQLLDVTEFLQIAATSSSNSSALTTVAYSPSRFASDIACTSAEVRQWPS